MNSCERCRKTISGNKRWCMTCVEKMAATSVAVEDLKKEEPLSDTTHILIKRDYSDERTRETNKAEDLYRADGLLIASRQADVVRYGDDISTARNHIFLNEDLAAAFLRRLADVDLVCQKDCVFIHDRIYIYANVERCPLASHVEVRDGESLTIEGPQGRKIVLATPGNMHSIKTH